MAENIPNSEKIESDEYRLAKIGLAFVNKILQDQRVKNPPKQPAIQTRLPIEKYTPKPEIYRDEQPPQPM